MSEKIGFDYHYLLPSLIILYRPRSGVLASLTGQLLSTPFKTSKTLRWGPAIYWLNEMELERFLLEKIMNLDKPGDLGNAMRKNI